MFIYPVILHQDFVPSHWSMDGNGSRVLVTETLPKFTQRMKKRAKIVSAGSSCFEKVPVSFSVSSPLNAT